MRLHYLEGVSLRAIARRVRLARRTVKRHLAKLPPEQKPSPVPRASLLHPYDAAIRSLLGDTPELKTPQILERLRALGYAGGVSILRDRVSAPIDTTRTRAQRGTPEEREVVDERRSTCPLSNFEFLKESSRARGARRA